MSENVHPKRMCGISKVNLFGATVNFFEIIFAATILLCTILMYILDSDLVWGIQLIPVQHEELALKAYK